MKKPLPFLLILLLLCCTACNPDVSGNKKSTGTVQETKALVYKSAWGDPDSVTVTLTAQNQPLYTLILTPDGELVTVIGMANTRHKTGDSVTAEDYAVKRLADKEQEELSALKNNLGTFQQSGPVSDGVWLVSYHADGAEYYFHYGHSPNKNYDAFVTKLIACSALLVTDIQKNAVKPDS